MEHLFTLFASVVAILIAVYWFSTKTYDYWKNQNVPFLPNPKPLFGHMFSVITLRESPVTFADKAYKSTSASMIGFYFIRQPAVVVRDPELIKSVLRTNFSNFRNNVIALSEKFDPILAKNPFLAANANVWKEKRVHMTNHLSGKKLRSLLVIIQEVCSKMCKFVDRKIDEQGDFYECELKQFFVRCTGEIVANAAFGIEGQSFEDNPDRLSFTKSAECVLQPNFSNTIKQTMLFFVPDFANFLHLKFLPEHSDAYFRENVKSIIKQRKQQNIAPDDYLQFSIDSNPEGDLDSIVVDVVNFYMDVYETTSTVLAYLIFHLSRNPEVQTKLREHVVSKLGSNPMTYESLKELTYIDQVLNETLRLSSPLSVQMKRCTEEITLTGSDGLKCHLKPGYPVFIPVMSLHTDEKYWNEPEKFDPERFSPENQASIEKFAFLSFGEGPRMCVGMRLGVMITKMVIASLIMKFGVEPSAKMKFPLEIEPTAVIMSYKGGAWAKFKKL